MVGRAEKLNIGVKIIVRNTIFTRINQLFLIRSTTSIYFRVIVYRRQTAFHAQQQNLASTENSV